MTFPFVVRPSRLQWAGGTSAPQVILRPPLDVSINCRSHDGGFETATPQTASGSPQRTGPCAKTLSGSQYLRSSHSLHPLSGAAGGPHPGRDRRAVSRAAALARQAQRARPRRFGRRGARSAPRAARRRGRAHDQRKRANALSPRRRLSDECRSHSDSRTRRAPRP